MIGRGISKRQESLREAAEAKKKSAEHLKQAKRIRDESHDLQMNLYNIRRENHFAERFGSALKGIADDR